LVLLALVEVVEQELVAKVVLVALVEVLKLKVATETKAVKAELGLVSMVVAVLVVTEVELEMQALEAMAEVQQASRFLPLIQVT
jgi:hypothetical protein|tara:strand:- start:300 stop:551 length:252 start_codon:yes stop_codon:yes gene_type:complete